MRSVPSGALANELSGTSSGEGGDGRGLPSALSGPDGGTCRWGRVPAFGKLPTWGSTKIKEQVEWGFIFKKIVTGQPTESVLLTQTLSPSPPT